MRSTKKLAATAVVAAVAVTGLTTTVVPANAAPTAPCGAAVGFITPDGHHGRAAVTATKPPTSVQSRTAQQIFHFPVGLSTTTTDEASSTGGRMYHGTVVTADALVEFGYSLDGNGHIERGPTFTRIGGGWADYTAIERVSYVEGSGPNDVRRTHHYGLHKDGTLTRWLIPGYRNRTSYKLGADVKAMVLISKTRTYETFLVTTKAGALKSVRIPVTSPLRPVIKTVRASTWQGFETLIAHKCGANGIILTAVDKDTKSAYAYTLGRANGTSTVITGLGKVPGTFDAPVHFRWAPAPVQDQLVGE